MKCPNCENEIDAWAIVEEEKIAFMRNLIRAGQRRREEAEARGETLPTALEICYSIMNAPNPMWETIERLRKEEEAKEKAK